MRDIEQREEAHTELGCGDGGQREDACGHENKCRRETRARGHRGPAATAPSALESGYRRGGRNATERFFVRFLTEPFPGRRSWHGTGRLEGLADGRGCDAVRLMAAGHGAAP